MRVTEEDLFRHDRLIQARQDSNNPPVRQPEPVIVHPSQVGSWHGHIFEVSYQVIRSFSKLTIKASCETEDLENGLEEYNSFKKANPTEFSLTVHFNALLGIQDVRAEAAVLLSEARGGVQDNFYCGGARLIDAPVRLTACTVKNVEINNAGLWVSCDAELTFKQATKAGEGADDAAAAAAASAPAATAAEEDDGGGGEYYYDEGGGGGGEPEKKSVNETTPVRKYGPGLAGLTSDALEKAKGGNEEAIRRSVDDANTVIDKARDTLTNPISKWLSYLTR